MSFVQPIGFSPRIAGRTSNAPHWEWRIFETFPGRLINAVHSETGDAPSIETHLLSAASPHSVTIRNGELDVSLLVRTHGGDLELWRSSFKRSFPLDASQLSPVWAAWNVSAPTLRRQSYTVDQFLKEVVRAVPALRAVQVTKSHARFTVLGCHAERGVVGTTGGRWDTLALESEDSTHILSAQRALAGALPRGSSYPAMLKSFLGMPAARTASA